MQMLRAYGHVKHATISLPWDLSR